MFARLTFILLVLLSPLSASSQHFQPQVQLAFGGGMNLSYFDIGGGSPGFSLTGGARYQWDKNWMAGLNIGYHQAYGTDEGTQNASRGYAYSSSFFEVAGRIEYIINFSQYPVKKWKHALKPYFYAGVGILQFQPKLYLYSSGERVDHIINYITVTPVINCGFGFYIIVNNYWSLSLEGGPNFLFSDYLEGYSSVYSTSKDIYHTLMVKFIWKEPISFGGMKSGRRHR